MENKLATACKKLLVFSVFVKLQHNRMQTFSSKSPFCLFPSFPEQKMAISMRSRHMNEFLRFFHSVLLFYPALSLSFGRFFHLVPLFCSIQSFGTSGYQVLNEIAYFIFWVFIFISPHPSLELEFLT